MVSSCRRWRSPYHLAVSLLLEAVGRVPALRCAFVYGGFVGSDKGSVPLSANIFIFSPPIRFRNPYHYLRKDKLVVAG